MGNLLEHAKREIELAGLDDPYDEMQSLMNDQVLDLIEAFASQGHSGFSASYALGMFNKLVRFETISPNDHSLYRDVSDMNDGKPLLQDIRDSRWLSRDGGKSWFNVEAR